MHRPPRLLLQEHIQHRLELSLHPCCLKDANCLVGSFVEYRVSQDNEDLLWKPAADFLNHRMEGPARLAGRVEELDQRDWSVLRAETGRMGANQKGRVHGRGSCGGRNRLSLTATGQHDGSAGKGGKPESRSSD